MNPTSSQPLNSYLNNFVQPPPNAASLGKYADYPVGYYTGVPNISIPIYNLKDGGISLPVSLSYHASGIRVSELASWVGLGWALNATGVINRTVRGAPDEGSHNNNYAPNGYYQSKGLSTMMTLPYPVAPNNTLSDPQGLFYGTTVNGILNGGTDTEPDLYTFNFNGHTGKFVFDEQRVPRLLEDDNLKIRVISNATHNYFNSWVITTEDGVQYYFGENYTSEMVRPRNNNGAENLDDAWPSAWYLTTIINPNTKDTATFNYAKEGYSYYDLGPESKLYGGSGGVQTDVSFACNNALINSNGLVDNLITTAVQGLRLTSIVTKNYIIQFVANTQRLDLSPTVSPGWKNADGSNNNTPVYDPPYRLDAIKIITKQNGNCIKQFSLGYDYFSSAPSTTTQVVLNSVGTDVYDTKRLKLTSVTEIAGDGTIQKPPYVLTYQESPQLPRRLSYDQDHWGFSNNSAGNYNLYFTPQVFSNFSTYSGGSNRHPKWPDMSAFTLINIKDPLGVSTSFTYLPNSANNGVDPDQNPAPADTLVGGLKIQQIVVNDNVTNNVQVRTFSYNIPGSSQTSGDLRHFPIYLLQLQNEFYQNSNDANATLGWNTGYIGYSEIQPGNNNLGVQILKQSQGIVPLQDANGNHIVYSYVKESFGPSGSGGYKQYHLASEPETATAMNSKLNFNNFTAFEDMVFPPPTGSYWAYYGNGNLNDTTADTAMLPQNLGHAGVSSSLEYPFAPKQADFYSGKVLEEDTYDTSNNLVESVTNNYSLNYHENFWIRGLKAYVQNLIKTTYTTVNVGGQDEQMPSYNTPSAYNALTFYKLHTGVSHLISTTKKTYNGSNYVAITTNYGYESPAHTLKTSDTTIDSQGNVLINKTYYSADYANTATTDNIFWKMKVRNLLAPVRTDSWKNGNLIGEKVTQFYDFAASSTDTLINPINVYNLETASPLTPTQAGETATWSAAQNTLIPNSYLISKVNFSFDGATGRMTNQQLTADKSQGIQWSIQLALPVALVDNVSNTPTLKEFYYEGFEESTSGQLYTGNGHTGIKSVFAPYTVNWTLPNSRTYVISYWYLYNGVWTFSLEQNFTGSLTLSGGTAYDDIRIHPSDANMVTYTYDAAGNLTSTTDAKSLTTYYEYDSFQRLRNIRDYQKNIVKSFCYNYNGQANGCFLNLPSYTNASYSGSYTKNNCAPGYAGSVVTYTVPAGLYISNTSATAPYNQTMSDLALNGQNYANATGSCLINVNVNLSNSTSDGYEINFSNTTQNLTFPFSTSPISVPAGTYNVIIFPTGAYNLHNISLTGQTTATNTPRASFNNVIIATGSSLTASVY